MFYEPSETILLFGPRYLHLDLFQFLLQGCKEGVVTPEQDI